MVWNDQKRQKLSASLIQQTAEIIVSNSENWSNVLENFQQNTEEDGLIVEGIYLKKFNASANEAQICNKDSFCLGVMGTLEKSWASFQKEVKLNSPVENCSPIHQTIVQLLLSLKKLLILNAQQFSQVVQKNHTFPALLMEIGLFRREDMVPKKQITLSRVLTLDILSRMNAEG